jgi:hypothetical protein
MLGKVGVGVLFMLGRVGVLGVLFMLGRVGVLGVLFMLGKVGVGVLFMLGRVGLLGWMRDASDRAPGRPVLAPCPLSLPLHRGGLERSVCGGGEGWVGGGWEGGGL